jgi:hypothetical protein
VRIEVGELTTCSVDEHGEVVELAFHDPEGNPVLLRVPFDRAQALAMTLPQLLSLALRQKTGDTQARYVFPLSGWRIEDTPDNHGVITTFATDGGFEVSFCIPLEACAGLGWALKDQAGQATDLESSDDRARQGRLN